MSTGVDVFMPFYIGDYLKDTADLTAEEHGAYLLLLMHLWNRGGELTSDPCRLARLAAVDADRWPAVWSAIGRFFSVQNDTITQGRLYHELKKAEERRRLASEAGKASAEARAQRTPNPPPNARVNGTATEAPTETQPDGQRNGNGKATLHSSHSHSESTSESTPKSSSSRVRAREGAPLAVLPPPPNDDDISVWALFGAICGERRLDPEALTKREERATETLAAWCVAEEITEEDVFRWGEEWYELTRRKTGKPFAAIDPPTCDQLREYFAGQLSEGSRVDDYAAYVQR